MTPSTLPLILAVDDELVSLKVLEYYLTKAGHRVVAVSSAAAARKFVAEHGPGSVQCVVTDYRMPAETGLELLLWIKQQDPALSVIMATGITERELVAETLRGGATDFLDKPISEAKLLPAVELAIALTTRQREAAENDRAVRQVGATQHQLFGLGVEAIARLELCFHPRHQAGGDFVNYFPLGSDQFLVLTADVSGHDMYAAFVSAYFQGMMRGMLEAGQSIATVLAKFNRFLVNEWSPRLSDSGYPALASVSACAAVVDLRHGEVRLSNHGAPQPWLVHRDGRTTRCETLRSHPLGWFDELEAKPSLLPCPDGGDLVLWTDGLEDLALDLRVSPFSLIVGLWAAQTRGQTLRPLAQAKDDILVVSIRLDGPAEIRWRPVLDEPYRGNQESAIDELQAYWERCLDVALPDLSESRRFDVLLALRESAINAMLHGCGGRAEREWRLTLCVALESRTLRAMISDPGPGHNFVDLSREKDGNIEDLHRGLGLINRLATQMTLARHGAELILDFRY